MTKVTFLGTGGGRFVTIFQKRATGGIYIADRGILIHLDPGPGALVQMHRFGLDPTQTDLLLISHCHPDHYTDAEILIEGMAMGGKSRKGQLLGSKSVIDGTDSFSPISPYHKGYLKQVFPAVPGDIITVKGWYKIEATPTQHSDLTAIGFKLHLNGGIVSYTGDTEYFEGLASAHKDARVLIICLTRPLNGKIPHHLCTEEAAELVKEVKPELAILTHMGIEVLNKAAEQATWIAEHSGVYTIAARDGMSLYLEEKIEVKKSAVA
jgi:phosphoribosyl 1,2-cyclic phosphodiesterase